MVRITFLQAETDIRDMGVLKDQLEEEYGVVKFLGQVEIGFP